MQNMLNSVIDANNHRKGNIELGTHPIKKTENNSICFSTYSHVRKNQISYHSSKFKQCSRINIMSFYKQGFMEGHIRSKMHLFSPQSSSCSSLFILYRDFGYSSHYHMMMRRNDDVQHFCASSLQNYKFRSLIFQELRHLFPAYDKGMERVQR